MLHLSFFRDFKGADTVLLAGEPSDLLTLSDRLASLLTPGAAPVSLHSGSAVEVGSPVQLWARRSDLERGVHRREDEAVPSFDWDRSPVGWRGVLDQLQALAAAGHPCHAYLEADGDEAVIMAAAGEYPEVWWLAHP